MKIQNTYYATFPITESGDTYPSVFPTGRYQIISRFFETNTNALFINFTFTKDVTNKLMENW